MGERDAYQDGRWAEVNSEAVLGMFMTMSVCVVKRVLSTEMTAMSKHKSLPVVNWSLLFQFSQLGPPQPWQADTMPISTAQKSKQLKSGGGRL